MLLNKKFSSIAVCWLLTTAFLSGCTTFSDNRDPKLASTGSLKPQSILRFNDIPVPAGLKPLPLESYSFESSGVRVGALKYLGKANADQIVNFYRDQMPMYNWNLVNIIEFGQRLMNFERESESCIITMQPKGSNVILTISLGPKSQGTTRRNKQLVK